LPTIDAIPYAWPWHGRLEGARLALVVHRQSAWRPARPDRLEAVLGPLVESATMAGALVVDVVDDHGDAANLGDVTVVAHNVSAFFGSNLDAVLRREARTDLVLVGWGLEGPVHSTMREANDRGFECLLLPDACSPVSDDLVEAACSTVMHSGGIFGGHARTPQVLVALAAIAPGRVPTASTDTRRRA
jgi:nicotinamidase-related amidase